MEGCFCLVFYLCSRLKGTSTLQRGKSLSCLLLRSRSCRSKEFEHSHGRLGSNPLTPSVLAKYLQQVFMEKEPLLLLALPLCNSNNCNYLIQNQEAICLIILKNSSKSISPSPLASTSLIILFSQSFDIQSLKSSPSSSALTSVASILPELSTSNI